MTPENAYAMDHLRRLASHRLLTHDQEKALSRRIQKGDMAAREELATANIRLVVYMSYRYAAAGDWVGMTVEDLFGYGVLGLMTAVDRYDWQKGTRFSTVAAWWIRQAITRNLNNLGRLIRLPVHHSESLNRLHRAQAEVEAALNREPSVAEVAARLRWTTADVEELRQYEHMTASPLALDVVVQVAGGEEIRLEDVVPAPEPLPEPEGLRAATEEALAVLTPHERAVVRALYGIDAPLETSKEVAARTGTDATSVHKIRRKALNKLKKSGLAAYRVQNKCT